MHSEYISALLTIPMGIVVTLKYAVCSLILGIIIGVGVTGCQLSKIKPISYIAHFYISILRGTPLLLQLSLFYFALPSLLHCKISMTVAGILCFSLNSSAYLAEIFRGGIKSIDKGQFEAADSLNITWFKKYFYIIIPQVIRNVIPAVINEAISLVKESSIISIIGESDIMHNTHLVSAQYYTYFVPLLVAGTTYYILIIIVTFLAKLYEQKMNFYG